MYQVAAAGSPLRDFHWRHAFADHGLSEEDVLGGATMQLTIREARNDDAQAIRAVLAAVRREYDVAPDADEVDADLADLEASYARCGGVFRVVVSSQGQVVGAGGLFRLSPDEAEIRKMYFLPAARGRGLGKRLLNDLIDEARRLGYRRVVLETASVLERAIGLYRSAGFRPTTRARLGARCDQAWVLPLSEDHT